MVRREIRIGARRPGEVEVLDGRAAGDRVSSHGTLKVRPGQEISIRGMDHGQNKSLSELLSGDSSGAEQ